MLHLNTSGTTRSWTRCHRLLPSRVRTCHGTTLMESAGSLRVQRRLKWIRRHARLVRDSPHLFQVATVVVTIVSRVLRRPKEQLWTNRISRQPRQLDRFAAPSAGRPPVPERSPGQAYQRSSNIPTAAATILIAARPLDRDHCLDSPRFRKCEWSLSHSSPSAVSNPQVGAGSPAQCQRIHATSIAAEERSHICGRRRMRMHAAALSSNDLCQWRRRAV